jgi:hypothetical protein
MFNKDLEVGSMGADVYRLQQVLEKWKYGDFIPTGIFGPKTREAIKKFQIDNAINPAESYFGPKTRLVMNAKLGFGSSRLKLYQTALEFRGVDASPNDLAPDEFGCAETVEGVYHAAFGTYIGGRVLVSTTDLYKSLLISSRFTQASQPQAGAIIISPTGYSSLGATHGHTGICGENGVIMSNDSRTGMFMENYTTDSWRRYYHDRLGFPIYYFIPV